MYPLTGKTGIKMCHPVSTDMYPLTGMGEPVWHPVSTDMYPLTGMGVLDNVNVRGFPPKRSITEARFPEAR